MTVAQKLKATYDKLFGDSPNLCDRVDALEADDFTVSLVGSVLTFSNGETVDLSQFLDNTDDQNITAFSLSGTTLTLAIESGNTVTVDLSTLPDLDQQTLSIAGDQLTISNGNTVTITHPDPIVTTAQVCSVIGWANVNADGSVAAQCGGVTAARVTVGRYTTVAPAGAVSANVSVVEDFPTRDSITARKEDFLGATLHITEGDNGAGANTPRDQPFTIVYFGQRTRVINVTH